MIFFPHKTTPIYGTCYSSFVLNASFYHRRICSRMEVQFFCSRILFFNFFFFLIFFFYFIFKSLFYIIFVVVLYNKIPERETERKKNGDIVLFCNLFFVWIFKKFNFHEYTHVSCICVCVCFFFSVVLWLSSVVDGGSSGWMGI